MLGKVIKYDLKWIYKPLVVFYCLALLFSVLTRALSNIEHSIVFNVLTQICSGTVIAMMINIIINNLMRCWARFVKNIYKDESYLTHTLPVKNQDIFLAKVISGIITIITSFIIIILCVLVSYGTKANLEAFKVFFEPIEKLMNMNSWIVVSIILAILVIEFIFVLISGYLGIVLGHKSNNMRIVKSVIFGFMAFMVMSISSVLLLYIVGLFNENIMNLFNTVELPNKETIKVMMFGEMALYVFYIVIYYVIGNKIIKCGVNVE